MTRTWFRSRDRSGLSARALLSAALLLACGGDANVTGNRGGAGGAGIGGVGGTGGDGLTRPPPDAGSGISGVSGDAACATESVAAQRLGLDLYLMLDSSYSMLETTASGMDKWDAVKAAIAEFMMAPESAGIGLGLQFFPVVREEIPEDCYMDDVCGNQGPCLLARTCAPDGPVLLSPAALRLCDTSAECPMGQTCTPLGGCSASVEYCTGFGTCGTPDNRCVQIPGYCRERDRCEPEVYATPTVAIADLPGVSSAVLDALGARRPQGRTPTGPALAGALTLARQRMAANPERRVAVVLASDGFPVACLPNDIQSVAVLAEAAARENPPVSTFAVGVVAPAEAQDSIRNLGAIAAAGGTGRPYVINTGQDVTAEFLGALAAIRTSALPCEFKIPAPTMGQVDYTRVNVQYTDPSGQVITLGNVRDRAACDPALGGWYYDADPRSGGTPSAIVACSSTCRTLQGGEGGRVDIVLGCRTVVIE